MAPIHLELLRFPDACDAPARLDGGGRVLAGER